MNICEFLDSYSDEMNYLHKETERTGKEHGQTFCESDVGEVTQGEKDWISIDSCDVTDSINIDVHTHPSGNIGFSENDLRSFITQNLQYPPDTKFDEDMIRGKCVLGKRLGDTTPTLHCIEATDKTRNLSIEEQKELSHELFSDIREKGVGFMGVSPRNDWSEYVNECYSN